MSKNSRKADCLILLNLKEHNWFENLLINSEETAAMMELIYPETVPKTFEVIYLRSCKT